MLILWQDPVAAEAHVVAAASAAVVLVEVHAEAEASVADHSAVHTVVASEAHTTVDLSADHMAVILAAIITIITAHIFTDQDTARLFAVVDVFPLSL